MPSLTHRPNGGKGQIARCSAPFTPHHHQSRDLQGVARAVEDAFDEAQTARLRLCD